MKNLLKKLIFAIVTLVTFQTAFAQKGEWKESQTFHTVMSKTFHPSEEGNLQPVKDNAANLLANAKLWQASKIPAAFNQTETKKVLVNLVSKCDEIIIAVKSKKSDDDLKKLISEAHEIFHQIEEKCRKPETEK